MNQDFTVSRIIINIFENTIYKWVFIGAFIAILLIPIAGQKVISPMFYNNMMDNVILEAKQIGTHIARYQNTDINLKEHAKEMSGLKIDFNLYKIKLFDKDGYVIFSTDEKDVGQKNKNDYFYNKVAKGEIFYKIVTKGEKTLEGVLVPRDVAEIYIPIINNGSFAGSSEIYYDITQKRVAFNKLMEQVSLVYISIALLLLLLLLMLLYIASKLNLKEEAQDLQLFQQSKMAAMGEMIGNIAHQWRQPLTAISAAASGMLLHKEMGILKDDTFENSTKNIVITTEYLSKTIDDFRNFYTTDKEQKVIQMEKLIDSVISLVKTGLDNTNIKIIINIEDVELLCLENELKQALMNILMNAKDILKTKNISHKYILIDGNIENDKYLLSIYDNGGGISDEIIDKVFEPYFTTKHQAQGTGIGLYMTNEIITKHLDGDIGVVNSKFEYENKKYYGAKFIVELPIKVKDENEI